ncbi:sulfate ABC transporter permease subunit CysT [Robbsia andropogonis]|uniref:sulfate ABC transporter permease subunit CysT n=1 Tax=Robbsia andropogonis TaxID=28092 RepID=UPI001EED726B|nr:sulfate ABC transporter permease subunit CysT [Robbsia andropogonis]MCP1117861.1 sulfate ABC transporter permease subunit CysT [Robbsia andropogonis]MCP1127325.1 sulfate ABC transporter permease subunit CysT [Robbsia andropogonis]
MPQRSPLGTATQRCDAALLDRMALSASRTAPSGIHAAVSDALADATGGPATGLDARRGTGNPTPPPAPGKTRKSRRVLPGFGLTLGFSLFYLCLMVFVPLSALFFKTAGLGWDDFVTAVAAPRVLATYRVTFGCALIAALINLVFGLLIAWVLVRYRFPGKRIIDALVDLPFALPTAVAGISLTAILSNNGWLGQYLSQVGIHLAYNPAGIVVALTFISLPFVVRTVQPVLEDSEAELEEAAASLGATRWQIFSRVILPAISPALLTGFAMAFARAVGEYGSVVFIAGNMPMVSEITPLLIMVKLEQFDYAGASAVAVVLMVVSFVLLLAINGLQAWQRKLLAGGRK